MFAFKALLLCAVTAIAAPLAAECILPSAPSKVPDGATASDEEMRAIMLAMADYETDMSNHLKCLAFEAKQGRLTEAEQARRSAEALERHQAAVARFNAQMKLYMAR